MSDFLREKIDRVIWRSPPQSWGAPGRYLFVVLRYLYAVLRDMFSGQLTLRAMSLVYTTLLSVVPLIAFSFSVLKGLGIHEQLEVHMSLLLEPLGERGHEITATVMNLVHNVNGSVLGSVALAFFLYTAISMVQKVEESFNYTWYVTKPRNFARQFTEYVLVILTGPVAIVMALGMLSSLQNETFVQYLLDNELVGPVLVKVGQLFPYVLVTCVFAFLYWFMPNTRVRVRSALVGGLAGGVLWATLGAIVASFITTSAQTRSVYGGFAIAITALIWLYLNWLVLLVGAQLAYYHQNPAYLRIGRRNPRLSSAMRERLALNIMLLVGQSFRDPDKATTITDLSRSFGIPTISLLPVITSLEEGGLLRITEDEQFVPGRDTAAMKLSDILAVIRDYNEAAAFGAPRWSAAIEALGQKVDSAISATLDDMTLAQLLDQTEADRLTP